MQSKWFDIAQVYFTQLAALATSKGVGWLENPALPLDGGSQPQGRTLFCIVRGDVLIKAPGAGREERRMRLVIGARSVNELALAEADALHFAARSLVKSAFFRGTVAAISNVGPAREVEIEPDLKDMAAQGTVLMSAYEIDYFQDFTPQA